MEPRILQIGSQGPQAEWLTQGSTRKDDAKMLREHSPWSVRWIEASPTEDSTKTQSRFVFPGSGTLLHGVYLMMEIEDISAYAPVGPNLIREVVFRGDGSVLDRLEGSSIAILHDIERGHEENIGRDRLEQNVSGGIRFIQNAEIIVDLPFWFRRGIHTGIPMTYIDAEKHEFLITTHQPVARFTMIFEVSDLPRQDIAYLHKPGKWELPVTNFNRFTLDTNGREQFTVRIPFTDELYGLLFAFRPTSAELLGNFTKYNSISGDRTENDLEETAISPLYNSTGTGDCVLEMGEILQDAELVVGNMVLERREAWWWREQSWYETGRQPPDRVPYIYGRAWDITPEYPSGGTFIEHTPGMELRIRLRKDSPNCTMVVWGLVRNVAEIRERKIILRNPFNG